MTSQIYQREFAERLRHLRLAAGLTIEEASELAGLSPGFWSDVERNVKEPCLTSLHRFAATFNMNVSKLLSFDPASRSLDERQKLIALMDLLAPDEFRLAGQILQLIYDFGCHRHS